MSLCINPNCFQPSNPDNLYCQGCGSELCLRGRYRVTRLLGGGGFGKTYEVVENNTTKVLKVLTNNEPIALRLFEQEAKVLSQLNHPGIPKGEGSFTYFPKNAHAPLHCLSMEKIEGVDLEEYMKQHRFEPIEQKLMLEWLFQLTGILKEVHRQNFFHRDIKPSNIILKPNGQLVLIDFGAVRQVTATILAGEKNTGIHTPGYAPPEQEKGFAVQESDFYALGRTFVYLLTGKNPNSQELYDFYNNEFNWRKYAPHISPQVADLIDELMAEKANQRPANASVIYQRLKEIVESLLTPTKPTALEPPVIAKPVAKTVSIEPVSAAKPSVEHQLKKLESAINPPAKTPAKDKITLSNVGFWMRFRAFLIDRAIIATTATILGGGLSLYLQTQGIFSDLGLVFNFKLYELVLYSSLWTVLGTTILGLIFTTIKLIAFVSAPGQFLQEDSEVLILAALILGIGFQWFYYIVLESSWLKTTPGKAIAGIIVTDEKGKKLSLKRANQRYWSKYLSIAPLYFGFVMTGFTKKKQALHDRISKTYIVKK